MKFRQVSIYISFFQGFPADEASSWIQQMLSFPFCPYIPAGLACQLSLYRLANIFQVLYIWSVFQFSR